MIDDIDEGAACDNDDIVDEESSPNVQVGAYDYLYFCCELGSCKQCICVAGADTCRL